MRRARRPANRPKPADLYGELLTRGLFFPPLVMGVVKMATGGYALGFALLALMALACLATLIGLRVGAPARPRPG